MLISHSELRAWQGCRRRWWLSFCEGWQAKAELPTGVVHIGSHIHLALEGYYGYGLDPLQVLRWSYEDVISQQPEYERDLRKDLDLAEAMTDGYITWVQNEGIDAGLTTVATEHEVTYTTHLPHAGVDVTWRGKLDLLMQRKSDGRYLLRDFKTVGDFGKANALLLDQQMRFYAMLLAFEYPDARERFTGALYMMIKRSKRTARATGPFYQQAEVAYNSNDLNSTYLRALAVSEEIAEARRQLSGTSESKFGINHRFTCYPNPTDFCTWGCQFYKICPLFDDGSRVDDALTAEYRRGDPYYYYESSRIERARQALEPRAEGSS